MALPEIGRRSLAQPPGQASPRQEEANGYGEAPAEEVRRSAPPPLPPRPLRTQKLTLDHEAFSLVLNVYDFNVGDTFISFSVDSAAGEFAFKGMCSLRLIHQHRVYPVTYVGGHFDFPQHHIKAIAFVRDLEAEKTLSYEHDQERQSGDGQDPEPAEREDLGAD